MSYGRSYISSLDLRTAARQAYELSRPPVSKFSTPVKYARLECSLEASDDLRIVKGSAQGTVVFTTNEDKERETTVISSTDDARKFANAILDICREADKA